MCILMDKVSEILSTDWFSAYEQSLDANERKQLSDIKFDDKAVGKAIKNDFEWRAITNQFNLKTIDGKRININGKWLAYYIGQAVQECGSPGALISSYNGTLQLWNKGPTIILWQQSEVIACIQAWLKASGQNLRYTGDQWQEIDGYFGGTMCTVCKSIINDSYYTEWIPGWKERKESPPPQKETEWKTDEEWWRYQGERKNGKREGKWTYEYPASSEWQKATWERKNGKLRNGERIKRNNIKQTFKNWTIQ